MARHRFRCRTFHVQVQALWRQRRCSCPNQQTLKQPGNISRLLVLEGIQDPGNPGALPRRLLHQIWNPYFCMRTSSV